MTTYEIDTLAPFPADLETVLDHERNVCEVPAITRARLMARARESVGSPEVVYRRGRPSLPRPVWLAAAAGVMLVAAVATAIQLSRGPQAPRTDRVAMPASAVTVGSIPEIAPLPSTAPTVAPRASVQTRADMVEELRLLDRARQADARGDYAAVLISASEHERRFPHGRLAEDREVLRMRAYVGLGRGSDAQSAAARFRRQFPRSVLLQKIDDLLGRLR